jgi:hypothetical protein
VQGIRPGGRRGDAARTDPDYDLFALTRDTIKRNGRYCINFTRVAVVVLNQKVRPFTARWHSSTIPKPLEAGFPKPAGTLAPKLAIAVFGNTRDLLAGEHRPALFLEGADALLVIAAVVNHAPEALDALEAPWRHGVCAAQNAQLLLHHGDA